MIASISRGDYTGSKVVIGCPSVGNVSQFAVDLLVSSLEPCHVGTIWHDAVLPLVGTDPYDTRSKSLCTSVDVYFSPGNKLLLVQMRSPLRADKNRRKDFLQELVGYFKGLGVESFVVLAGLFAHSRDDTEISAGSFRFVTCAKASEKYSCNMEGLQWNRMAGNNAENNFACPRLSGAGFARHFFDYAVKEGIPCTMLLYFCSEGDNIPDGVAFTQSIDKWLNVIPENGTKIVYPPSWNFMYGNSVPIEIY